MLKRFEIGMKNNGNYNELIYVNVDEKTYTPETLSEDVVTLLTALSYVDECDKCNIETYENLSLMLGYETVINGLNKLHELGKDYIPYYKLRKLIMDMYKNKHKGLMR